MATIDQPQFDVRVLVRLRRYWAPRRNFPTIERALAESTFMLISCLMRRLAVVA